MIRNCGTFHGTIAATTPTGALRRWTSPNVPWTTLLPRKPSPLTRSSANLIDAARSPGRVWKSLSANPSRL